MVLLLLHTKVYTKYVLPSIDEVNKVIGECIVGISESRRVTLYDLLQLLEHRAPAWVREGAGGDLHERDAERPHVRPHVVTTSSSRIYALGLYTRQANVYYKLQVFHTFCNFQALHNIISEFKVFKVYRFLRVATRSETCLQ